MSGGVGGCIWPQDVIDGVKECASDAIEAGGAALAEDAEVVDKDVNVCEGGRARGWRVGATRRVADASVRTPERWQ